MENRGEVRGGREEESREKVGREYWGGVFRGWCECVINKDIGVRLFCGYVGGDWF